MTHPFLDSYKCTACPPDLGHVDHCPACNGSGRRFELQLGNLTNGHSFRVHDLLLQVTSRGDVRGKFDHWAADQWQEISSTAGLHTMLRNVIKNQKVGLRPMVFSDGWGNA